MGAVAHRLRPPCRDEKRGRHGPFQDADAPRRRLAAALHARRQHQVARRRARFLHQRRRRQSLPRPSAQTAEPYRRRTPRFGRLPQSALTLPRAIRWTTALAPLAAFLRHSAAKTPKSYALSENLSLLLIPPP